MSALDIKRRLDEISVRYKLEPSLKDVYVEGTTEISILRWFFDEMDKKEVYIYPIDLIEIPDSAFEEAGLSKHSNHNRVIVLAEQLSRKFNQRRLNVKCVADADCDRYLGRCRSNYILEYTDYTSMEMYFFNKPLIQKFLQLVLGGFPMSADRVIRSLKNVLQRLFLIHLANEQLGWNMTWVDFRRYISWSNRGIKFDEPRFLRSYLMRNRQVMNLQEFKEVVTHFEDRLHSDTRHNIRGHDFTYLFFLMVKRYKGHRTGYKDTGTFEGAMCGCLELRFVKDERLFAKLGG